MKSNRTKMHRSPILWIVLGCVLLSLIIAGIVIGICIHEEPASNSDPDTSDDPGTELPIDWL